jgi:hypothetical protein
MQRGRNLLNSQTMSASSSPVREIRARIATLNLERQRLEEEVAQLKAAVQIYTEVVRRWATLSQRSTVNNVRLKPLKPSGMPMGDSVNNPPTSSANRV